MVLGSMVICIASFLCVCLGKGLLLHWQYPNPKIQTYAYGETAQVGAFEITFFRWQWDDGSWIRNTFPDYAENEFHTSTGENIGEIRVGIIELQIQKVEESDTFFQVANIAFASGAWGNQFDMELFYKLNPDLPSMALDLEVGQTQKVVLPLVMRELQFTEKQWERIDDRVFYIDLKYYPEHIRFEIENK